MKTYHILNLGAGPRPKSWKGLSLEQRFAFQVAVLPGGYWLWIGAKSKNGYGVIARSGHKLVGAHRISHEFFKGPISDGFEVDHLCRNRACVNPEHLEAVSHSVNVIRGASPSALIRQSGFCAKGHPYTLENRDSNRRRCRVCQREKAKARYWRNRAS